MTKRCGSCKQWKGPTAFCRDNSRGDGLFYRCRACVSSEKRARRRGLPPPEPPPPPPPSPCARCQARQHGPVCLGPSVGCGCRCRAMLGLEGPFEFGDPTAPDVTEGWVA
jgi:hypothetical protein